MRIDKSNAHLVSTEDLESHFVASSDNSEQQVIYSELRRRFKQVYQSLEPLENKPLGIMERLTSIFRRSRS